MTHRVVEVRPRHSTTCAARSSSRARAAARPARPAGYAGPGRRRGAAARLARDRSRPGRRAGARLSARAVRRRGSGVGFGFRHGAARPADRRRRPGGLDRPPGRAVRAGAGRAGSRAGAPDRGPGAGTRCSALGARGGAAQSRARRRTRRGRPADPDREPAAAARRRSQGGERPAPAAARCRQGAERRHHALADRAGPERHRDGRGRQVRTRVGPAALAGQPVPLPRRPHRQLAGRLAAGGLA